MEIKNINYNIAFNGYKRNIKIVNSKEISAVDSVDKIELSTTAREIYTSDDRTYVDNYKIERIIDSLENGTYIIDSNKIAMKMLGMKG